MDPLYELDLYTINKLLLDYVKEVLESAGFESSIDFSTGHILAGVISKDDQYIIDVPTPYFETHMDEEKITKMLKVVEEKIGKAEIVVDYILADISFKYELKGDNLVSSIDIKDHRMVFASLYVYLNEDKVREILKYMLDKKKAQENIK